MIETREQFVSVVLKFRLDRNSRQKRFISYFKGTIVIPRGDLANRISTEDLGGKSIYVKIAHRNNGSDYYAAFPDSLDSLEVPGETINPQSRVAVIIDGQNVAGSIIDIRKQLGVTSDIHKVIEASLAGYQNIFHTAFCICSHQITSGTLLNSREKFALRSHHSISLETFDAKKTGEEWKSDADKIIIPELAFWAFRAKDDVEGIVLFAGDSDYERTCQIIAGIGKYARYGSMPIDIVSSVKALSWELHDVTHHPNCRLFYLEDFT